MNVKESKLVIRPAQLRSMAKQVVDGTIDKSSSLRIFKILRAAGKKVKIEKGGETSRTGKKIVIEKSVSKQQQKFMGMVRAVQKGEMDAPSPEVAKAAKTMKKKDVEDFAKTKHKGLPVKKEDVDEATILRTKYKRTDKRSAEKDRKKAVKTFHDIRKGKYPGVKIGEEETLEGWRYDPRKTAKYKELSREYEDEKKFSHMRRMQKAIQQQKKSVKKEEFYFEEAMLNEFSDAQLAQLKKAYADLDRINVTSPTYKKLKTMIANMDVKALEKVARAKVRFVSQIAAREYEKKSGNRLKAKDYMESVEETEITEMKLPISDEMFKSLKKGDKIKINFDSSIKKGNENTYVVQSKSKSAKYNLEKIKLKNASNPVAQASYLYNRQGKVTMSQGDMAVTMNSVVKEAMSVELESLEEAKVPDGMKFAGGYNYKGTKHVYYTKGNKATSPVVVYIDDKMWKEFPSLRKAQDAALAHIKSMKEQSIEEKRDAGKSATGYDIYHDTYSAAMQHAYAHAKKKHGVTVRPSEIDNKVALGPRKPSTGKTVSHILKTDKKQNLHVQVYNTGRKYELNMYVESVELDEGSREADIKKTISIMKKYPANKGKSEKELRKGAIAYLDQKKESVDEAALKTSDYPKGTSMSARKFKDFQKKMSKQRALTTKDYPKGTSMSATAWKNRQEEVELDEQDVKVPLELLKLYNKGMALPAGSIEHKKVMKQIDDMRKKLGMKESVELDEAIDFRKAFMDIQSYAKKNGGMDKTDFEKVAYYVKAIGDNQNTPNVANKAFMLMKKHIAGLDTDVRDGIHMLLKKHGMIKNGRIVQESIELDEKG